MATPDGKSRNKKKKFLGYLLQAYRSMRKRDLWSNGLRRVTSNLAILALIILFSDREQRYSF